MSAFLDWLEDKNRRDTRVRAELRRSLAFAPGTYPRAFPHVEPFLKDDAAPWRREAHYLVAALWAAHWKEGRDTPILPIGRAAASHRLNTGSASTEARFIALLDADGEQLPYRLRQMLALLKEQSIDFGALLEDLLRWYDDRKRTQNAWARDFYQVLSREPDQDQQTETEEKNT